jgi:hypothetical protein
VLLKVEASQKRKESDMQYDEILEMVITELIERGYKQHSENPEVNKLVLRMIELNQQV